MRLARPGDAVVLAAAAVLVAWTWATFWTEGGAGERVKITGPDRASLVFPLAEDRLVEIPGRLGGSRIEIAGGRARFVDSPCVGRYCVHAGWLSRGGDVAACLPNGVVAEIEGPGGDYDAISY